MDRTIRGLEHAALGDPSLAPVLEHARERAAASVTPYQAPKGSYLADFASATDWLRPHLCVGTDSTCDHCPDTNEGTWASWQTCDGCGARGATLYAGHAQEASVGADQDTDEAAWVHLDFCQDCVLFLANGDLPECREDRPCGEETCEDCGPSQLTDLNDA